MDYEQDVPYADSCKKAITNGIVVNSIQCGNLAGTEEIWREIARRGEGRYFRVQQDGGAVVVDTPFDEELAELSKELEATRVYYGDPEARREMVLADEEMAKDRGEAPASAKADRAKFLSSAAGGKALGRGRDLVTDLEKEEVKLEDVKKEHLPEKLQKMDADERAAYLKKLATEREELRKKILQLSKKRDAFVRKEMEKRAAEGKGSGFDALVMEAAREQAARKGIEYKEEE
jgi:hypothetical protein